MSNTTTPYNYTASAAAIQAIIIEEASCYSLPFGGIGRCWRSWPFATLGVWMLTTSVCVSVLPMLMSFVHNQVLEVERTDNDGLKEVILILSPSDILAGHKAYPDLASPPLDPRIVRGRRWHHYDLVTELHGRGHRPSIRAPFHSYHRVCWTPDATPDTHDMVLLCAGGKCEVHIGRPCLRRLGGHGTGTALDGLGVGPYHWEHGGHTEWRCENAVLLLRSG
ncbi:hypothetical protein PG984_008155 [Apiospora sp. TS-2023a]